MLDTPLGYIASDIYARYKRHKGFNVLHPQGYDSFGLPAEPVCHPNGTAPSSYDRSKHKNLPPPTSIKWGFHLIGLEKCAPLHPNITNGHNGFLSNYLTLGITTLLTKQRLLMSL